MCQQLQTKLYSVLFLAISHSGLLIPAEQAKGTFTVTLESEFICLGAQPGHHPHPHMVGSLRKGKQMTQSKSMANA